MDIGLIAKRKTELEENYFGADATISINKVLSFGYAKYDDIFYEDLRNETITQYNTNGDEVGEIIIPDNLSSVTKLKLDVETFIWSLKYGNFAFDHLTIKTVY